MTERKEPDEWMSKQQVANELDTSIRTVERLIASGEIQAEKLGPLGYLGATGQKLGKAGEVRIARSEIAHILAGAHSA